MVRGRSLPMEVTRPSCSARCSISRVLKAQLALSRSKMPRMSRVRTTTDCPRLRYKRRHLRGVCAPSPAAAAARQGRGERAGRGADERALQNVIIAKIDDNPYRDRLRPGRNAGRETLFGGKSPDVRSQMNGEPAGNRKTGTRSAHPDPNNGQTVCFSRAIPERRAPGHGSAVLRRRESGQDRSDPGPAQTAQAIPSSSAEFPGIRKSGRGRSADKCQEGRSVSGLPARNLQRDSRLNERATPKYVGYLESQPWSFRGQVPGGLACVRPFGPEPTESGPAERENGAGICQRQGPWRFSLRPSPEWRPAEPDSGGVISPVHIPEKGI